MHNASLFQQIVIILTTEHEKFRKKSGIPEKDKKFQNSGIVY